MKKEKQTKNVKANPSTKSKNCGGKGCGSKSSTKDCK